MRERVMLFLLVLSDGFCYNLITMYERCILKIELLGKLEF